MGDSTAEFPIITIGMPIHNRRYCIDAVLSSISSQSYPRKKIKLIFVDNFSTDGTYETLQQFLNNAGPEYLTFSLLRVKSNIPQARNICVKEMSGDLIFFWDSDVLAPDVQALERMIKFLSNDKSIAALGFPCLFEGKTGLGERMFIARVGGAAESVSGLGLGFTLIRKNVFDTLGLFNEKMVSQEDTEFFLRMKGRSLKAILDSRTVCKHLKPEAFGRFRILSWYHCISYLKYLKYCFGTMPWIYDQLLATRSVVHYFRLAVYLLIPAVVCISILIFWPVAPVYFLALLMYHVHKAKHNRLFGFVTFAYYFLPGLAISYGYLFHKLIGK
jgi:glycosyltransferase involved in cell wall biosynthesis